MPAGGHWQLVIAPGALSSPRGDFSVPFYVFRTQAARLPYDDRSVRRSPGRKLLRLLLHPPGV